MKVKPRRLLHRDNLPRSRAARIGLGGALVLGGLAGFLPILGFWMLPLGIAVLSVDIPVVRRGARKARVKWGRWRQRRPGGEGSA